MKRTRVRYKPTCAPRDRRFTVQFTEDEFATIHAAASAERVSVSAFVRAQIAEDMRGLCSRGRP